MHRPNSSYRITIRRSLHALFGGLAVLAVLVASPLGAGAAKSVALCPDGSAWKDNFMGSLRWMSKPLNYVGGNNDDLNDWIEGLSEYLRQNGVPSELIGADKQSIRNEVEVQQGLMTCSSSALPPEMTARHSQTLANILTVLE